MPLEPRDMNLLPPSLSDPCGAIADCAYSRIEPGAYPPRAFPQATVFCRSICLKRSLYMAVPVLPVFTPPKNPALHYGLAYARQRINEIQVRARAVAATRDALHNEQRVERIERDRLTHQLAERERADRLTNQA